MSSQIKASLKSLKQLAPQLNKIVDDAAQTVREVEKFLVDDLKLSILVETDVASFDVAPGILENTTLKFCRVNGKFRIAVVKERATYESQDDYHPVSVEVLEQTPWLEASREEKTSAFVKLPDLLEAIVKKVEETIAAMEKAKPQVEEILASMK